ncbi:MAG: hypothetical protein IJZ68_06280 [Bacteroidaceae bacterium]|nr:hypothetical protein [Bacteroidaceae bacterium]
MQKKVGVTAIGIQTIAKDINKVLSTEPRMWFDSLEDALYQCTDALLAINATQPVEGWKLPAVVILYDEQKDVFGAFAPSFAETWDANHRNTEGIYIPKNQFSDFLSRIQSAINAWDVHYFDDFDLHEPTLMAPKDTEGHPILFEHYGATRFNPDKVEVRTCATLKPTGFWACQQFDNNNWAEFQGGYIWHTHRISFNVNDTARILNIDSIQDIQYLQKTYPLEWSAKTEVWYPEGFYDYRHLPRIMIDWAKVSQEYDGIWYNYDKLGNAFGPFDMNSISIFNPDVIEIVPFPDVLRFPEIDDETIMQMLSEEITYTHQEYYAKLQFVADFMLSHIEPGDVEREEFYLALYDAALLSHDAIEKGTAVPLENWDYIASLNELADAVQHEREVEER